MNRFKYSVIRWRAHRALAAAMRGEFAQAGRIINSLNRQEYGLVFAMQLWIDATVEHASGGLPGVRVKPDSVVVYDSRSGDVMTPDAVDRGPATAWAIAVVNARTSRDADTFARLLAELPPDDPEEAGRYVGALLVICAASIADFPRGYAVHTAEMMRREEARRNG